tara:strand:- start:5088 stop:7121 length:2034 start_codon:yes stop_codon:yes gene_type:complete
LSVEASSLSVILSFILSLVITGFFYFKDRKNSETASWIKLILASCRFFIVFIVVFLLFKPIIVTIKENVKKPNLLVLIDNTASIVLRDSREGEKVRIVSDRLRTELSEMCEVHLIPFGTRLFEGQGLDFKNEGTNVSRVISLLSDEYVNENIGSVVLISDGIQNVGMASINSSLQSPIYTVGVGDTGAIVDAAVLGVYHNDVSFKGDKFNVELNLSFSGLEGVLQKVIVELNDRKVKEFSYRPVKESDHLKKKIYLKADSAGLNSISCSVSSRSTDKILSNNFKQSYIKIIEDKQNVLFVSNGSSPDARIIKSTFFGDDKFKLESKLFKEEVPNLEQVDAVVLIGNSSQTNRWLKEINKIDVGFLWFTGVDGVFKNDFLQFVRLDESNDNVSVMVDESFDGFDLSGVLKAQDQLPPIAIPFGKWKINGEMETVFNQKIGGVETSYPLFLFSNYNGNTFGVFIGEGLWRWGFFQNNDDDQSFINELLTKSIRKIASKSIKSGLKLRIKDEWLNNEEIKLVVNRLNDVSELTNEKSLLFNLMDANGVSKRFDFLRVNNHYELNIGLLPFGVYNYSIGYSSLDSLGLEGGFIVKENKLESESIVANHYLLKKLSQETNGEFYLIEDIDSLIKKLKSSKNFKSVSFFESVLDHLIKNKWIFFIVLILASLEWFVRKWQGII